MDLRISDVRETVDEDAYLRDFIRAVEHKDQNFIEFVVPIIKEQRHMVKHDTDICGHYLKLSEEDSSRYDSVLSHALILSAHHGVYAIAQYLIHQGVDVNSANQDGDTALIKACERGHADLVDLLLSSGAEVNHTNRVGWSALLWVTRMSDRADVVDQLLRWPATDVNLSTHKRGMTALHVAAEADTSGRITQSLLDKGAMVNTQSLDGSTPLHLAVNRGHVHNVELLLQYGAYVNIRDSSYGSTALHVATQHRHVDIVRTLLKCGADEKIQDWCGRTALERMLIYAKLQAHNGEALTQIILLIKEELPHIQKYQKELMVRMIESLCELIPEERWSTLFEELFGSLDALESVIVQIPVRTSEASLSVLLLFLLHQWMLKYSDKATFWVLMRGLRDHRMSDIADEMVRRFWKW